MGWLVTAALAPLVAGEFHHQRRAGGGLHLQRSAQLTRKGLHDAHAERARRNRRRRRDPGTVVANDELQAPVRLLSKATSNSIPRLF